MCIHTCVCMWVLPTCYGVHMEMREQLLKTDSQLLRLDLGGAEVRPSDLTEVVFILSLPIASNILPSLALA